ncbi:hypothetical protein EBU99_11635, partial [bacterium]|nr:hypothetical protein [bacterium]
AVAVEAAVAVAVGAAVAVAVEAAVAVAVGAAVAVAVGAAVAVVIASATSSGVGFSSTEGLSAGRAAVSSSTFNNLSRACLLSSSLTVVQVDTKQAKTTANSVGKTEFSRCKLLLISQKRKCIAR